MTNSSMNEFIATKVKPEYRDIIDTFRRLIKEHYPDLKEEMRGGTEKYYGVPVYRKKRLIIAISPTKNGITFAFSEGASFEDKYNLLEGVGKKSLNLRLKSIDEFNEEAMRYYIDQAIRADLSK